MLLGQPVRCNLESLFNRQPRYPKFLKITTSARPNKEYLTLYPCMILRQISNDKSLIWPQHKCKMSLQLTFNVSLFHYPMRRLWLDPEGPPFPNTNLICNLIIKKWFRSTFAVYFHNIDHDFSKEFYFHSKRSLNGLRRIVLI